MKKGSLKKKLFLALAAAPFLFRRWSIQKKLFVSLLTLIAILGFNALLTTYELHRLKEHKLNLSYLIYLDLLGILSGSIFIWVLLKSVIRPMKNMIKEIQVKESIDPVKTYSLDELGDLARAVSSMKRTHLNTGDVLEEKTQLIEAILDHAVDCIFIFNQKGEILTSSRSFLETFGYSKEQLEETDLSSIIPAMQLQEILENFSGQAPSRQFYVKRLNGIKSNQKTFYLECSICPVRSKKETSYVAIIRRLQRKTKLRDLFKKAEF